MPWKRCQIISLSMVHDRFCDRDALFARDSRQKSVHLTVELEWTSPHPSETPSASSNREAETPVDGSRRNQTVGHHRTAVGAEDEWIFPVLAPPADDVVAAAVSSVIDHLLGCRAGLLEIPVRGHDDASARQIEAGGERGRCDLDCGGIGIDAEMALRAIAAGSGSESCHRRCHRR